MTRLELTQTLQGKRKHWFAPKYRRPSGEQIIQTLIIHTKNRKILS